MLAKPKTLAYLAATSIPFALLIAQPVFAAPNNEKTSTPIYSEEFWHWFDRYADDEGNLLDPLELSDVENIEDTADSNNESNAPTHMESNSETHTKKDTSVKMTTAKDNNLSTSVIQQSKTDKEESAQ